MGERIMKIIVNNRPISLSKSNYIAAGGEGTVYCKDSVAYKIYHDPKRCLPLDKIDELKKLSHMNNVLGPQDIIFNTKGNPIGFTMQHADNVDFLCRLFTRSFRDRNNITPEHIVKLVHNMQKTLTEIHNNKILVVDYNEMNFLVDQSFRALSVEQARRFASVRADKAGMEVCVLA